MLVLFNYIPGNLRVPGVYAEFNSGGTAYTNASRLLLVGQKLSTGSAVAGQPIFVREGQASGLGGSGSMLAEMDRIARLNAPLQEVWWLPLDDLVAGVKATGTITVAGAPVSQTSVLPVYIAGKRVRINVSTSDTNNSIATALAAAINAESGLPVTATAALAVVTLTARHKGTLGNFIQCDAGMPEEDGPLGASLLTFSGMSTGAGDPDLAPAFANLGDEEFDWISLPYSGATELGATSDLLNDVNGRWSWLKQLYGHATTVGTGTVGALTAFGQGRNNQHESIFPCRKFQSEPWSVAAAVGAKIALHKTTAPELSRPLQNIKLEGIKGPRLRSDQLTATDRQSFYFNGVSGYKVERDGSILIDRIVTTFKRNVWGDPDWTYLDIDTMAQSMFGIRYLRTEIGRKHARQALARDNPGRLPHICTPKDMEMTVDHAYNRLVTELGVFEDLATFQKYRVVEIDGSDPNRINVGISLDHVNQLRVVAIAATNYVQYPT